MRLLRRKGDGRKRDRQLRRIRVKGSYEPSTVHVTAGRPTRLLFRREETALCSERLVLPDYGINMSLPPFENVTIDLPPSEPGVHEFTCELQMLHGRLVVDPDGTAPHSSNPRTPLIEPSHDRPGVGGDQRGHR